MDTETNSTHSNPETSSASRSSDTSSPATGSAASADATPTMEELLTRAPVPSSVCDWITCMRKAGISLSYSLEKRHIPDMKRDAQASASTGRTAQKSSDGATSGASGTQTAPAVGSIDTMTVSGTCRIRYFDLALGAMALLAASVMVKCCCCMKKLL